MAEHPDEIELTIVTMTFEATDPAQLLSILSKYVVLSRQQEGCRNIDLCLYSTRESSFLIIEKWESPEHQKAHFDSPEMVEMAQACVGVLANPPTIDLLEGLSAHDLK